MVIAILDDDIGRRVEMERLLFEVKPDAKVEVFDNAPDMIAWLARRIDDVTLVSLAHDLGPSRFRDGMLFDPGSGRDVADFLNEMDRTFPIIVHAANVTKGDNMCASLRGAGWSCARIHAKRDPGWISTEWVPKVVEFETETHG